MFCRHADLAELITRGRRVLGWPWQFRQQLRVRSGCDCESDGTAVLPNRKSASLISDSEASIHMRQALVDQTGLRRLFSHLIDPSDEAAHGVTSGQV